MTSNDELRIEICQIDNSTLQNEVFLPIFAHFSTQIFRKDNVGEFLKTYSALAKELCHV